MKKINQTKETYECFSFKNIKESVKELEYQKVQS